MAPRGCRMARAANEDADPVEVDLLCAGAIVHVADALAQLVQNPGGLMHSDAGFHRVFTTGHASMYSECKARLQAAFRPES